MLSSMSRLGSVWRAERQLIRSWCGLFPPLDNFNFLIRSQSPKVYGCGQDRYSYRGHEIIEHGGSNPGFKTQVSRFPNDNLGVIVLSNDENGRSIMETVKWRIVDHVFGLEPIDWAQRYCTQSLSSRILELTGFAQLR
jgi:hypothetical protein